MNQLSDIPGIGPKNVEKFSHLKITTISELLNHFPSRYLDFSTVTSTKDAHIDQSVTIYGTVTSFQNIYTRSGKNIQKAILKDDYGSITLIWFSQPYLSRTIKIGEKMSFAGTISLYQNQKTIIAAQFGPEKTGKILPLYPETKGLTSNIIRKAISHCLSGSLSIAIDPLSPEVLKTHQLMSLPLAYQAIHQPKDTQSLNQARLRLSIAELLSIQAQSIIYQNQWHQLKPKHILKTNPKIDIKIDKFIAKLPYQLTQAQKRVWQEVKNDLTSTDNVTNRLIQGDVGSGKTIIAILSSLVAFLNHKNTIILAPTQILANQHYQNFNRLLSPQKIKIALITSSSKIVPKTLKDNHIIIATQAIFYQKISKFIDKTAIIIIDEQHKFGVKQRSFLQNIPSPPHLITMTATPIPRTISLTLLGNLKLSIIDQLPLNRLPIKTFLIPSMKQTDCYQWINQQITRLHQQAYFVCPYIDQSESDESVSSAKVEFEILKSIFTKLNVSLIHGKMKPKEKEGIMENFRTGKIDILVTTPIIEVGIDIPNASIITILSAEKFGLAQLHQLRGRVGRGSDQSYCYLFTQTLDEKTTSRLKFVEKHHFGLDIAEYDLKIRGPGEIFSYLQHGFPSLKLSSITNLELISLSQKILDQLLKTNPDFPLSSLLIAPVTQNDFSLN